jgi:vitamin K-dependent gamma-carboxylase
MTNTKIRSQGTPIQGSPWIVGFVIVYVSLQILIPLRHLLYKRDLLWTHEGSNFSWRMMADHHETNVSITIEDPRTKKVFIVDPRKLLNDKQLLIATNPYMMFQYVQFLKQLTKDHMGIKDPIIKADIEVSVNGRPFQHMFDPACNLSEVNYSAFKDLKWILPLKKT